MLTRENVLKNTSIINSNGFSFKELSNIPKINLRGESAEKDFINNVVKVLDITLPIIPNTSESNDKLKIIWLSPNEWLIEIYEIEDFEKILSDLKNSLNSQNTAVTDVTESKTILRLNGLYLYKLLSKFMIINLDKALDKEFSVAQTIFIKVPVLIIRNHQKDEEQSIYLHANRSHSQYIIDLLIEGTKNIDF
jgi:sarcosine oxidase subunit gamma|tara:strand:- start:8 stop:586 length:579 start_codon:yes stop_codon:yes gene_type:complete